MDILVGKVLKAQGIKGELKLQCFLDSVKQMSTIKTLAIANRRYKVKSVREYEGYAYVYLDGIIDRNSAELLRDWEVYTDKAEIELPQNSYFIEDLLGSVVFDDNQKEIGKIIDISQYGSADVYTVVDKDNRQMSFPWLKDLVVSVDIVAKKIVVSASRLQEVGVYQDEN